MIAFSSSTLMTVSAQPASESYYGDSYESDYDAYEKYKSDYKSKDSSTNNIVLKKIQYDINNIYINRVNYFITGTRLNIAYGFPPSFMMLLVNSFNLKFAITM